MAKYTIKQQLERMTSDRCRFGSSKYQAKQEAKNFYLENPGAGKFETEKGACFYSRKTYNDYLSKARTFVHWAKEQSPVPLKVDGEPIKDYIEPYLQHRLESGCSTYTVHSERSALSKVFKVDLSAVALPQRSAPVKGRGTDRHFNPDNHKEQLDFYRAVGARKNEYRFLRKDEIHRIESKAGDRLPRDIHGRVSNLQPVYGSSGLVEAVITIKAKHGKTNRAIVLPQHQKAVTEAFRGLSEGAAGCIQWFNPSDHTNVHQCRREYAQEVYRAYARDISSLSESELYRCRKELAGCVYDRAALDVVSTSLGHGEDRHYTLVHNYMR